MTLFDDTGDPLDDGIALLGQLQRVVYYLPYAEQRGCVPCQIRTTEAYCFSCHAPTTKDGWAIK